MDLWIEYFQYSIGEISKPDGLKRIREIGERGLTAVGKHVSDGLLMWSAVRELENAVLAGLQVRNERLEVVVDCWSTIASWKCIISGEVNFALCCFGCVKLVLLLPEFDLTEFRNLVTSCAIEACYRSLFE